MKIKKLFQRSLDIVDPVSFCENKKENTLILLNNKYGGRCEEDVFIIRVLEEDLYIGKIQINLRDKERMGMVDVKFVAEVKHIHKNSIILAQINNKTDKFVILKTSFATIAVPLSYNEKLGTIDMSAFKDGQYLPIKIQVRAAPIMAENYIAKGILWLPFAETKRFTLKGDLKLKLLEPFIEQLKEIKVQLDIAAKSKHFKYLAELLYPFAEDRSGEIDRISLQSLANIANGSVDVKNKDIIVDGRIKWCIDPYVIVESTEAENTIVDAHEFIESAIIDHIYSAQLLIDMVGVFINDGVIQAHKNLWNLFAKVKLINSQEK